MADSPRIEELRRRVQSDPASIAFAALAEEYRRAGRFEEAIDTCRAGLVRHPSYLSAHVTLGRALLEMDRLEEAREELEHVLTLAPENLAAIRGLAEIHERLGDDHHHSAQAEPAASPAEPPAEPHMTVAEIQAASGFFHAAPPEEPHEAPAEARVLEVERPEPVAEPAPASHFAASEEASAVESVAYTGHAEPLTSDEPALAGLEEFLKAILRARAERAAAR